MQGKFWAEGSDSSLSSDSNGNDGSFSESEAEAQSHYRRPREINNNRWAIDSDFDSSEDDRRVVRGAKEKFHEELRSITRLITNHIKISDFAVLSEDYEKLLRCIQKSRFLIDQYGIPRFLILVLVELELFLDEKFKDKEGIKKLSKAKATSFNTLRAKFRKTTEEYKAQMDECKANPDNFHDDTSEKSFSDSSSYSESEDSSSDDEDDTSESRSDTSSSTWSSDEEAYEDRHASALAKWGTRVKKPKKSESDGTKRIPKQKTLRKEYFDSSLQGQLGIGVSTSNNAGLGGGDMFSFEGEVTVDMIVEKVGEIVAARGKKGTDRQEQIRLLKRAADIAKPLSLQVYADVLTHLISAQFDTITGAFHCISASIWSEICQNINILLDLIVHTSKDKRIYISGFQSFISSKERKRRLSGDDSTGNLINLSNSTGNSGDSTSQSGELDNIASSSDNQEQDKSTVTFLVSFIERLDGESLKALQLTDVHSSEYKDRLVQSLHLLALLWRCYKICEERKYNDLVATLSVHLINQLHFKSDLLAVKVWEFTRQIFKKTAGSSLQNCNFQLYPTQCEKCGDKSLECTCKPSDLITQLVHNVYLYGDTKNKLRVLLQHVYNMALHDKYYEAINLFQSMGVYDMALGSDVNIQILYNRALVQLGLAAFRLGAVTEAQALLSDICMPNRNRELLAQGMSNMKSQERTPEQERAEKRRLLPYHMHLSLEVIDCIYLICSMLLEIPYMAYQKSLILNNEGNTTFNTKFKPISKQFRRLLEQYERQPITGPPESQRDTIIAATRALQLGKWKECCDYIFSLSIWDYNIADRDKIEETLKINIKQEALRTYIFTYGHLYDSFSVKNLSDMFGLSRDIIHSLLSKMMLKNELLALWDQSGDFVLLNHKHTSKVQSDAMILSDKLQQFMECNESMISSKNTKSNILTNSRSTNSSTLGINNTNTSGLNYYSRKFGQTQQYNKNRNIPISVRPIRV
ncbi:eukaryotic translation initiation factor 3 subunit 8 family protein [Cryptosporidium muris RN66]|uniref:Eukaryotic translation initiation factor 3 subunit C n=1 Tax=Cryptosporidium muris (strain RN66) TaxID=441375 RepID=B6AC70_CRYMR|nr:eukaryotic translation initiation factor 3 subunit 8 family protein [Cryptosporidium muris RN66]EEA06126.1 eukaryotic translation initiation factor 3 subunit 8 family protein [Cryptosporidium muris RN66]|eukprot:XP_002140475.1 eukaryotic translation initiation factor 3 subunit 8 family protein [Cryptosporidium muris RN66]